MNNLFCENFINLSSKDQFSEIFINKINLKYMNIFRIENKYKIELNKLDELYKFLNDNKAEVLFPKRFIKSIYFDNNSYSSYFYSLEGIVPRKKLDLEPSNLENFNRNNILIWNIK